jgi:hypothetical protein
VSRLSVYSRGDCGLCEELLAELLPWAQRRSLEVEVRDIDADPQLRRRYGHRIPVLLLDGEPVCHGHLDVAELERLLGSDPR